MRPVSADFSVHPPRLGGAALTDAGRFARDHVRIDTGRSVALEFPDGALAGERATLTVTALAATAAPGPGRAPMTVSLNGHELVSELIVPGGVAPEFDYAVAPRWLAPEGPNTLVIANGADGADAGALELYRVTLQDGAPARASVLTYRTLTRSADRAQTAEGPTLRVYLDRGEQSPPSQLEWTAADGTHSAIGFHPGLEEFSGVFRHAHGEPVTLHGRLTARAAYDEAARPSGMREFEVECSRGDSGGHPGTALRLLLDDGRGGELAHLAWRDQAGNSASVSFTQNRSGFVGYSQRSGEGPVGMRGTALAGEHGADQGGADQGTEGQSQTAVIADELKEDLAELRRQVLGVAEEVTGRLSSWLRDRGK